MFLFLEGFQPQNVFKLFLFKMEQIYRLPIKNGTILPVTDKNYFQRVVKTSYLIKFHLHLCNSNILQ